MKIKKFILAIVITVALFSSVLFAAADDWMAPGPFDILSEDGSMVFRFDADSSSSLSTAAVYQNTDPPTLLYEVNNLRAWAYENDFFFSRDFKHFAYMPLPDFEIAIEFFSEGNITKTYYIEDLVNNNKKIQYSTSSAWWKSNGAQVKNNDDKLEVTTVDNLTYIFDITTGEILETHGESKINLTLIIIVAICVIGFIVFLFIRTKRKSKSN